jgi:CRISPR-associated protein Csm4
LGNVYIVRLKFASPLHIGADIPAIGEETIQDIIHSDTIFSAIINNYAGISDKKENIKRLFEEFNTGEAPFKLSSGYIYSSPKGKSPCYYLPRPSVDPPDFFQKSHGAFNRIKYGKVVRETRLVDLRIINNWINNKTVLGMIEDCNKQYKDTHIIEVRPRHARDRISDDTNIFHTGLLHLRTDSGIYFLIEINEKSKYFNINILEAVLNAMKWTGLGGKISSGLGSIADFDMQKVDSDETWENLMKLPDQEYSLSISLFYPWTSKAFLPDKYVAYRLIDRRGWTYSTSVPIQVRRKNCTMFAEGSVVHSGCSGSLVNVTPDEFREHHDIYRNGLLFGLPMKKYWGDCIE